MYNRCAKLLRLVSLLPVQERHKADLNLFVHRCLELLSHIEPVMKEQERLLSEYQARANQQLFDYSMCHNMLTQYKERVSHAATPVKILVIGGHAMKCKFRRLSSGKGGLLTGQREGSR